MNRRSTHLSKEHARILLLWIVGWMILAPLVPMWAATDAERRSGEVLVVSIDSPIHEVTAEILDGAIEEAERTGAAALVVELDTPGGVLTSTRKMVTRMLASEVPLIVWVAPEGAQAASAGFFILMGGDVAAMAPGTNTGAAAPIASGGQDIDGTLGEKVTQDTAAWVRSLAQRGDRPLDLAEATVLESRSYSAEEALESGLADIVAKDLRDLLEQVSDRVFERDGGEIGLDVADSPVRRIEITTFQKIRRTLADPNVAAILLQLGSLGILLELYNPGGIFPGVVGVICLVLGLYGMSVLPVNYAGVALLILAMLLFVLELKTPTFGLLTAGGVLSMVLGSLLLFDSVDPALRVSRPLIIATAIVFGSTAGILGFTAMRAARNRVTTGSEGMVGEVASVRGDFQRSGDTGPYRGKVFLKGEYWNAQSSSPLADGQQVQVETMHGMLLEVGPQA